MREILFRGKSRNDGKWYCGDLVTVAHKRFIDDDISKERVEPETVGQYTGINDKNGTKIFEGDVVEFYFFDKGHKNTRTMLIEWANDGFCMKELFRNYRLEKDFSVIAGKIYTNKGETKQGIYKSNNSYFVEIIGNIHDNPELLIDNAPTVTADMVERQGEWLHKTTMIRTPTALNYICSVCGNETSKQTPYCAECGARMVKLPQEG